jgi:hypothetical protein
MPPSMFVPKKLQKALKDVMDIFKFIYFKKQQQKKSNKKQISNNIQKKCIIN